MEKTLSACVGCPYPEQCTIHTKMKNAAEAKTIQTTGSESFGEQ